MNRIYVVVALVIVFAAAPVSFAGNACPSIKHGDLTYSAGHYLAGEVIPKGFDPFGYNYQGHMFSGSYVNVYLGGDGFPPYDGDDDAYLAENPGAANHWAWPYRNVDLLMKWNEAWLSNKDCDLDDRLDRHYGYPSYIGSGAWETNHMSGIEEVQGNGNRKKPKMQHWTYFTKIVAAPADATLVEGVWFAADGTEIGPVIWGQFATIQEVQSGMGATYISPAGPGLGKY